MLNRMRGNLFSRGKPQGVVSLGVLVLAAAFTLYAPQDARAEECLLDTNDNDIANGGDTDGGALSNGNPDSLACGVDAVATGDLSTAIGAAASATGDAATATGVVAAATGDFSTANGASAVAIGDFSTAVGAFATATAEGSTALGADAVATIPDEFVLGTVENTYTAPGIASPKSRRRQSGPRSLLTTDADGHLASDGGAVFEEVADVQAGVALALSMESPELATNESFAMRLGYGNFQGGAHAFGLSVMGNLRDGGDRRWSWDAGFGAGWSDFYDYDSDATWGGRAGIQMAW